MLFLYLYSVCGCVCLCVCVCVCRPVSHACLWFSPLELDMRCELVLFLYLYSVCVCVCVGLRPTLVLVHPIGDGGDVRAQDCNLKVLRVCRSSLEMGIE